MKFRSNLEPSPRIDVASRPDTLILEAMANPTASPRAIMRVCEHLIDYGRLREAETYLAKLLTDETFGTRAKLLLDTCRNLAAPELGVPETQRRAEAEASRDTDAGYWIVPQASNCTVVAFAGQAQRVGVSIYFLHRLLNRFNYNMVYLFDWHDVCYLNGVVGLGSDQSTTVSSLKEICNQLGTRRLLTLGQSAGGFAALRYGLHLEAHGTLTFSPIVQQMATSQFREILQDRLGRPLSEDEMEIRRLYEECPRVPLTRIYYGADHADDRLSAEALLGIPNLTIYPQDGIKDHGVLQEMIKRGTFLRAAADFFHAFV